MANQPNKKALITSSLHGNALRKRPTPNLRLDSVQGDHLNGLLLLGGGSGDDDRLRGGLWWRMCRGLWWWWRLWCLHLRLFRHEEWPHLNGARAALHA